MNLQEVKNMKIISRSKIAEEKIRSIQAGYTAFAETQEVIDKIKQELDSLQIDYLEEITDMGSWISPQK